MKKVTLLFCFIVLASVSASAQKFISIEDKAFNWGAKLGFNSTFPVINSLTINDVEAEEVTVKYKVGHMAAVFCRVNIERFFLQPSISWHSTEGEIHYTIPYESDLSNMENTQRDYQLQLKTRSLEMPVLIGYNLVKEGPYGLSLMAGPKFKYNYRVRYESGFNDLYTRYMNESTPFGINIALGMGVSIWRLFFDFTYEFGLNEVVTGASKAQEELTAGAIQIDKRSNLMSISLGFLF